MEIVKNFIAQYGYMIIYSALTGIAAAVVAYVKARFAKKDAEKMKREVVYTCITGVEQLYQTLKGTEKYKRCFDAAKEMLDQKGIPVTELELKMLIESCLGELNGIFGDDTNTKTVVGFVGKQPETGEPVPEPQQIE